MKSPSHRALLKRSRLSFDIVIVGGGLASATAIETLLNAGTVGSRIALIAAEPELPYHRPPLSKGYLLDKQERDAVFVKPRKFYDNADVQLFLGTKATAVDPTAHTVTTDTSGTLTYGKLLLSSGCKLQRLTVPGSDLPRIFYLRTLAHADVLKEVARNARTAVVVGGSFIGMELASAFAQKGLQTTLLHRGTAVFDKLESPAASAFFAQYYADHGVTIRTKDEVTSFTRHRGERDSIELRTKRGDTLTADLVAVGVGVTPNTEFLASSGIAVDNGVMVNEYLEASVPDVYAAGDVANFFDPLYQRHRRVEHWDTAIQHGKIAGVNLLSTHSSRLGVTRGDPVGKREAHCAVSYFFSDVFDVSFDYLGDASGTDHTILRGSFANKAVTIFYIKGRVVLAAFTMGRPRERRALTELIRTQQSLSDLKTLSDESISLPAR